MPWWIGTIFGSLGLSVVLFISKSKDITLINSLLISVPLIISNLGFWYGFRNSTSFLICWVAGSTMNVAFAFLLSHVIFGEDISKEAIFGVVFIMIGIFFLNQH